MTTKLTVYRVFLDTALIITMLCNDSRCTSGVKNYFNRFLTLEILLIFLFIHIERSSAKEYINPSLKQGFQPPAIDLNIRINVRRLPSCVHQRLLTLVSFH